eukprot:TRINITY_DN15761_c0_g1_i2.p1 TRINITY_DN15761_c0_g1~~TRINITY_DN15761_c0_g1_i2.p1  ORF type:complete len:730 (+),score=170.42 TRINITY_DN15761_c0_g1_i2:204-2192(+)
MYGLTLDDEAPAWRVLCRMVARVHGLYVPEKSHNEWKNHFFDKVLPGRCKWTSAPDNFTIKVSARFRPGETTQTTEKVYVPFNQRMMILKKGEKIVNEVPERFKDSLLGNTMSDPVRLPRSGRVCDRKVIMLHLRRHKTDPFTNSRLTADKLQPCPHLKHEIEEWKRTSSDPLSHEGLLVDANGIRQLAGRIGDKIATDLLDAVMEAERLEHMGTATMRSQASAPADTTAPATTSAAVPVFVPTEDIDTEREVHNGASPEAELSDDTEVLDDETEMWHGSNGPVMPKAMREKFKRRVQKPRVVSVDGNKIIMFQPGNGVRPFLMSSCFKESPQEEIYYQSVQHCVERTMSGANSCVLCYGQTSSGKTHTMFGSEHCPGVAPMALKEVVCAASVLKGLNVGVEVKLRYIQIYGREVSCLLTGNNIEMLRDERHEIDLRGCGDVVMESEEDVDRLLAEGRARKRMAATAMNETSSRSHTLILVDVLQHYQGVNVQSRMCLVDLAGSERVKKSNVEGLAFSEAVAINRSLLVLGKCMTALSERRGHIPYGESRLTLVLKASLGGRCATSIIVCCRHEDDNAAETLQTLRFAETCTAITSTAKAAAVDAGKALRVINTSLEKCKRRLALVSPDDPMNEALQFNYNSLSRKRAMLIERHELVGKMCP